MVNSKQKGNTFERLVVNLFKEAGIDAKRGWWQSGLHAALSRQARSIGAKPSFQTPDVIVPLLWVEASTGATPGLQRSKLEQAIKYADDYRVRTGRTLLPVSIVRKLRSPVIDVTMRLADFINLLPTVCSGNSTVFSLGNEVVTFSMRLLLGALKAKIESNEVVLDERDMFDGEVES